jgi:hypothetical protein
MRKSHFNDEFLVLLGPIISRLFTCSNEEKNLKQKIKGACSSPISMPWLRKNKQKTPQITFMKRYPYLSKEQVKLGSRLVNTNHGARALKLFVAVINCIP